MSAKSIKVRNEKKKKNKRAENVLAIFISPTDFSTTFYIYNLFFINSDIITFYRLL